MSGPDAAAAPGPDIEVEVALDEGPHRVRRVPLRVPAGTTLREAVQRSAVLDGAPPALAESLVPVLWGRVAEWDAPLRPRDRVELTRPLQVDPKEARRQRYRRDGLKRPPKA